MLIAITGGIGMGKTTILNDFASFGAETLDADDIAHKLYTPQGNAYPLLLKRWGKQILAEDKSIDRKRVAQIVFENKAELAWLNGTLHPMIRDEIAQKASGPAPVYCAIPLLYESGWEASAHAVIAVWCSPEEQCARLKKRGWDDAEITRRMAQQFSPDEKMKRADYAVITQCPWDIMREQCRKIHLKLTIGN